MQIVFKKDDAAEEPQEAAAKPAKKAAAAPKASKAGSGQKRTKQQQEDADDADEDDFDVPRRKQQSKKASQPASKVGRPVRGKHSCGGPVRGVPTEVNGPPQHAYVLLVCSVAASMQCGVSQLAHSAPCC
jgi:hypothetical protein